MKGNVMNVFMDPELHSPFGVSVTFLCMCFGWSSHSIILVDCDEKEKLATLATRDDGVKKLLSVFYNANTTSMLLGQNWTNCVLVKFKKYIVLLI
ncbi:hypothetical protein DPMN_067104 [Dreissena polymorpha]|uniref:Uncharacterized protein n=1 Tax=Dreissena polymorpha TaxID=45954 RepID=A0A9D3YUP6_DREPO|nr:hypothetical protein DPMN_067104 [Dreissena polymorpha]